MQWLSGHTHNNLTYTVPCRILSWQAKNKKNGLLQILPIEASMEGNRHNFSKFLYAAIGVLSIILASFGSLGYMRFGDNTQQMVNANIPSGQPLSIAVNACLCVGVILTYPLMLYPVVELAELYLFGRGEAVVVC